MTPKFTFVTSVLGSVSSDILQKTSYLGSVALRMLSNIHDRAPPQKQTTNLRLFLLKLDWTISIKKHDNRCSTELKIQLRLEICCTCGM